MELVQVVNEQGLIGEAQPVRKTKERGANDHRERSRPAEGGPTGRAEGGRAGCAERTRRKRTAPGKAKRVDTEAKRDAKGVKRKAPGAEMGMWCEERPVVEMMMVAKRVVVMVTKERPVVEMMVVAECVMMTEPVVVTKAVVMAAGTAKTERRAVGARTAMEAAQLTKSFRDGASAKMANVPASTAPETVRVYLNGQEHGDQQPDRDEKSFPHNCALPEGPASGRVLNSPLVATRGRRAAEPVLYYDCSPLSAKVNTGRRGAPSYSPPSRGGV